MQPLGIFDKDAKKHAYGKDLVPLPGFWVYPEHQVRSHIPPDLVTSDQAPVILCQLEENFAFLRQEKLLWRSL